MAEGPMDGKVPAMEEISLQTDCLPAGSSEVPLCSVTHVRRIVKYNAYVPEHIRNWGSDGHLHLRKGGVADAVGSVHTLSPRREHKIVLY